MFFFFKQKTAYEMRISDWSSDVCSSDLGEQPRRKRAQPRIGQGIGRLRLEQRRAARRHQREREQQRSRLGGKHRPDQRARHRAQAVDDDDRSEEHTSELQSLMRTSYAVFCLKKKKKDSNKDSSWMTHK